MNRQIGRDTTYPSAHPEIYRGNASGLVTSRLIQYREHELLHLRNSDEMEAEKEDIRRERAPTISVVEPAEKRRQK